MCVPVRRDPWRHPALGVAFLTMDDRHPTDADLLRTQALPARLGRGEGALGAYVRRWQQWATAAVGGATFDGVGDSPRPSRGLGGDGFRSAVGLLASSSERTGGDAAAARDAPEPQQPQP